MNYLLNLNFCRVPIWVFFGIMYMYKGLCRINDCDIAPLSAHVLHIYSIITSCIVDALSVVPC